MSGLADVCAALVNRMQVFVTSGEIDSVTDQPPPQLPDDRMIIVTPSPGTGTPWAHSTAEGTRVIAYQDVIVVEAHHKFPPDQMGDAIAWATPLLDEVRNLLWAAFFGDRWGGTLTQINSITTVAYGGLGWGTDPTFGWVLNVDAMHAEEIH